MDSRRDFTSKNVSPGYFSELSEKANSGLPQGEPRRSAVRFGEDASAPPLCGCSQSDSTADAGGVGGAWKGRAAPFLLPRPEGLHQHCTPRESSLLGDVRRFHGSGSGSSWWWCWWRRWWRLARGCYAGEWAGGAGGGGGRWAERHWRHGLRHWSVARGLGPATVPLFAC